MPRKPTNAPPQLTGVTMSHAIKSFFESLDGGGRPPTRPGDLSTSSLAAKRRSLAVLCEVAGGGHVLTTTLSKESFRSALTRLTNGASAAENEARRLKGHPPITGRSVSSLRIDRGTYKQFIEHCQYYDWMPDWISLPRRNAPSSKEIGQAQRMARLIPHEDFEQILDIAGSIHPRVRMAVAMNLLWARRIDEIARARFGLILNHNNDLMVRLQNTKRGRALPDIIVDWGMDRELQLWKEWIGTRHGIPQPDWFLAPARVPAAILYRDPDKRRLIQDDPREWPVDPLRPSGVGHLRRDYHKVLKIYGWEETKGEGGHTFRRSGGRAFEEMYGIEATQCLLDHESPVTTFAYTQNISGQKAMAEAMRNGGMLGPRASVATYTTGKVIPFQRRAH